MRICTPHRPCIPATPNTQHPTQHALVPTKTGLLFSSVSFQGYLLASSRPGLAASRTRLVLPPIRTSELHQTDEPRRAHKIATSLSHSATGVESPPLFVSSWLLGLETPIARALTCRLGASRSPVHLLLGFELSPPMSYCYRGFRTTMILNIELGPPRQFPVWLLQGMPNQASCLVSTKPWDWIQPANFLSDCCRDGVCSHVYCYRGCSLVGFGWLSWLS